MKLEGTYTALVTPFSGGKVDFEAFERLLQHQKEGGVDGVVPCGCTGEAATLSEREREALIAKALDVCGDAMKVIAGTGTNSTESTVRLTRRAEELGAHAAMLISPYYNKPTQEGLTAHFERVAEETAIPLVLYNVPGRTGVRMEAETVAHLMRGGRYVALKEAGGSVDFVSTLLSHERFTVLSGDDSLTLPMISVGARGVISVVSNLFPAATARMVRSALEGDFSGAAGLHYALLPVVRAAFLETNPAPIKAMLAHAGLMKEELRLPLVPVREENREKIRRAVDRASKELGR